MREIAIENGHWNQNTRRALGLLRLIEPNSCDLKAVSRKSRVMREVAMTTTRHILYFNCEALTKRETEVALLAAKGFTNKKIAADLKVAEGTIKLHLHRVYEKLGLANGRSGLTEAKGHRHGH